MKDHSSWMGRLLAETPGFGDLPINTVALVGSHDAATYGEYDFNRTARTQDRTIAEQLRLGARYFDLRPKVHHSVFYAHHGPVATNNDFGGGKYEEHMEDGTHVFAELRRFLKANPHEILILKFQNYESFGRRDYVDLVDLLEKYFTFDVAGPTPSRCALVRPAEDGSTSPGRQTLNTLLAAGRRVYVFFDVHDVPEGEPSIWQRVWKFAPSLEKRGYALWDPFWQDARKSLADDDAQNVEAVWWPWHEKNLDAWGGDGFFAMQLQMQVLGPGDVLSKGSYFNSAERSAKATMGDFRDAQGNPICNNARNIVRCVDWLRGGRKLNVLMFDYVEYGDLCDELVRYYRESLSAR